MGTGNELRETKYIAVGAGNEDLNLEKEHVENYNEFKYLGAFLDKNVECDKNIDFRIS